MSSEGGYAHAKWGLGWIALALIGVIVVVAVVGVAFALASTGTSGYGWMMGGGTGWGWMWGVGALMMAIPLLFLVLLIALLVRSASPPVVAVPATSPSDPTTEARIRYARGELTSEQFRQVLTDLRQS